LVTDRISIYRKNWYLNCRYDTHTDILMLAIYLWYFRYIDPPSADAGSGTHLCWTSRSSWRHARWHLVLAITFGGAALTDCSTVCCDFCHFLSGDEVVCAAHETCGGRGWKWAGNGCSFNECRQEDIDLSCNVAFVLTLCTSSWACCCRHCSDVYVTCSRQFPNY